ncbi:hypothetical protein [Burkholderia contaminans]|uniref:hypothetical protein n=2 Tax=Burkholderia contaminans TaxID=488447 RepID=UPI0015817C78|nr:hypothetical protein [Burkholderia contaminans]
MASLVFATANVSAIDSPSSPETKTSSSPRISSRKPFEMTTPYTVALVVDPDFGSHLVTVSSRIHTWIVATAANAAAAEKIWAEQPEPRAHSIERGVTTFRADLGKDRNSWCEMMLGSVDEHHNGYSHDPGYTVLEVYGIAFTERLRPAFTELGFSSFEQTAYGFRAIK